MSARYLPLSIHKDAYRDVTLEPLKWLTSRWTFGLVPLASSQVSIHFSAVYYLNIGHGLFHTHIHARAIAHQSNTANHTLYSSALTSINTRESVSLAGHAHAICFRSWEAPPLLHTLLFPLFCYMMFFVSSVQRMKCLGVFWQTSSNGWMDGWTGGWD